MIPSLVNLIIGGTSLVRGLPGVPSLLLRYIPERGGVLKWDRHWGAAPGWGTLLDAAPTLAWPGRNLIAKPGSIVRAEGQRDVITGDHARPHSDFLVHSSHPTEPASERRASDLSPSKRSTLKRQTKG
jgi:hypothetical protein